MRASSDSSLSDEGPSCSTSAAAQVSGRRSGPPAPLDEPASRGSRSPSPPTMCCLLGAHFATRARRNILSPQEVASLEEEPTRSRSLAPDQPEPRSRCMFADTVGFHEQRSLLRRNASLKRVRWLDLPSSYTRERFQDRGTSPCGSGRRPHCVRCHSPSSRESRQDFERLRLPEGHVRNRELRCLAPRIVSQSSHRSVSSTSIVSWVPTVIRVEKRSVLKVMLYSAVFLCLVVIAAFVLVLAHKVPAYAARKEHVCSTGGCLEHARSLLSTLNASVDPCHDFYMYVCGGDDPASSPGDALDRFYGSKVLHMLLRPGLEGSYTPTTTLKALIALKRCADRSGMSEAIEDFAEFMADRGISWPAQALRAKHAGLLELFDVLLDLSINWRVTLWFDVSAAYLDIDGSFAVSFSEMGALAWQRMRQLSTLDDDAYAAFVRSMSKLLTNGSLMLDDEDVEELRRDETLIRNTVLSLDAAEQHDLVVPLHKVGDVTKVISSAEWMTLLTKHLSNDFNISSHTQVLLLNEPYFSRIFRLFGTITAASALNVTGWMFAYVYAWTATPALDDFPNMGTEGMRTYSLCFFTVQEWLGLAHLAASFTREFPAPERHKISDVLKWTSFALMDAIGNSRSVSNSTKGMAAAKIQTTTGRHFWPPEPFFYLDMLDVMYDSFPAQQNNFFAIWTKSRKALRTALTSRYYGSLMTTNYRWRLSDVLYVYGLNWMRISLWAVYPPSYLKDGTRAMTYSGLGFQLARALVRTVDEHGRRFNYIGRESDWWQKVQNCTWDLAESQHEKREISDLFALELALDALRKSSRRDHLPQKIRGLEILSETQTFFVSYCSHFCDDPDGKGLCSLAANVSEFADAFSCQKHEGNACLFV
ncbi:neprilysin-like isoform X2 [Dermacentor albipictus]|uniref:neprilysin-like isoform X2 n=1 Tax=Dermacentor albipictus TaxID=60249 RepID=UPI0038FD10EB